VYYFASQYRKKQEPRYTGAVRWVAAITGAMVLLGAAPVFAQASDHPMIIEPALVRTSQFVSKLVSNETGSARKTVEGRGDRVRMRYASSGSFVLFIAPLDANGNYVPLDMMAAKLPATTAMTDVVIDVSVSPSWSLATTQYLFLFISDEKDMAASIASIDFEGPTIGDLPLILWKQFWIPEPYLPSSYHGLLGYRVFGLSVPVIIGIGAIACIIALARRSKHPVGTAMAVATWFLLVVGLRAGVDTSQWTRAHLTEWYANGTYDEEQDVVEIARTLRTLAEKNPTRPMIVFVCRDGTNFREKLLRYFAYPISFVSTLGETDPPTHVLVMGKVDPWSMENEILTCNAFKGSVQHTKTFVDGTELFSVSHE
jgi:hypothetical protein